MKPAWRIAAALLAGVILSGGSARVAAAAESITSIDKAIIVDCFLGRGTVRKIGGAISVRPVPGQRVRISKVECDTRGGESILYDAANPETAALLWSTPAQAGDPEAQNRLGQIYELGIGRAPDLEEAAKWYRRAADAGHRAAALNYAALNDRGLGGKRDTARAEQYYRTAMGAAAGSTSAEIEEARRQLELSQQRIIDLELENARLRASGQARAATQVEYDKVRKGLEQLVGRNALPAIVVEVGEDAGGRPLINLLDPNIVSTRGFDSYRMPAETRIKDIVGRVRAKHGIREVRVNGILAGTDRFGFFSARIPVDRAGTRVEIVAVDGRGMKDTHSFFLQPADAPPVVDPQSVSAPPATQFGNFHALVIGNHHYRGAAPREVTRGGRPDAWPDLPNAERDARSVAQVLQQKYAFNRVQLIIDGTHEQILNAINDYVIQLGPNDNLLIYYAGHGQLDLGKRGYWIPVDGETERNTKWIVNLQVTDLLQKMRAKKVLVVSDSCYAGAMAAAENGAVATIRTGLPDGPRIDAAGSMVNATTRVMMASGFLSPVDEGGGVGHSLFAQAFLDVLAANSGVIEGFQVFAALEARVFYTAQGRYRDQTPVYAAIGHAGHEGGDFFFVPASARR